MMSYIVFIVGTRPEIIKIAPVVLLAEERGKDYIIIHTGQHYDENMSKQFFTSLGLRQPDINLGVQEESSTDKLGEMVKKIGSELERIKPYIVLAQGDTISVLASCLASVQLEIPFGHLEAGLRSFDLTMPEERNRRIIDSMSSLYFAPSERAVTNLLYEGVDPKRIFFTGNTVVDAIRIFKDRINEENSQQASNILSELKDSYIICTIHRVANVEDMKNLDAIVSFLSRFDALPIVFLLHPRTKKKLDIVDKFWVLEKNPNIFYYESINYFSMIRLMNDKRCLLILTDSGGLQEEAAILRKPCLTVRSNTERPETVEGDINTLVPANEDIIIREIKRIISEDFVNRFNQFGSPYGKGFASEEILDAIDYMLSYLPFESPKTYKTGSKTYHLLELGATIRKEDIEDQFDCKITNVYDDEGNPKIITDKMKKGDRVRIQRG